MKYDRDALLTVSLSSVGLASSAGSYLKEEINT